MGTMLRTRRRVGLVLVLMLVLAKAQHHHRHHTEMMQLKGGDGNSGLNALGATPPKTADGKSDGKSTQALEPSAEHMHGLFQTETGTGADAASNDDDDYNLRLSNSDDSDPSSFMVKSSESGDAHSKMEPGIFGNVVGGHYSGKTTLLMTFCIFASFLMAGVVMSDPEHDIGFHKSTVEFGAAKTHAQSIVDKWELDDKYDDDGEQGADSPNGDIEESALKAGMMDDGDPREIHEVMEEKNKKLGDSGNFPPVPMHKVLKALRDGKAKEEKKAKEKVF